jgi:hypothetical protein
MTRSAAIALVVPVLVCPDELPRDLPFLLGLDAHQGDRKIAGDAVCPEPGLTGAVPGQLLRRCTKRAVDEEQAIGETLEEMGLVLGDPEVVQLDLGLSPSQRARAFEGRSLAVLLCRSQGLVPGVRHDGREHDMGGSASGESPLVAASS